MSARVAVTGFGPVWRDGAGMDALAAALYAEQRPDAAPIAAAPPGRDAAPALRQMDGLGRLAVAGARAALAHAGFVVREDEADRVGLAFGTGYGCLAANFEYLEGINARGTRYGNPIVFQNTVPNAATGYVAIATGIRGPNATFSAGRSAGAEAVGFGREQIEEGWAYAALCGGADQMSTAARRIMDAQDPHSAAGESRPFDQRRDGIVANEASCFALLEELSRAEQRRATIRAEIVGMGQAGGTDSDAPPVAAAIRAALSDAGLAAAAVDLVVSTANGSRRGDRHEAQAIAAALGPRVPVSCPQARLGETVGAAVAFGIAAASLIFATGQLPVMDADFVPDPECPLFFPALEQRALQPRHILLSIAGDDATAHALLLRRYEP